MRKRLAVFAIAGLAVAFLSGCGNRDEQIAEVVRTGYDVACAEVGGRYISPSWPTGELPAACEFTFPYLP